MGQRLHIIAVIALGHLVAGCPEPIPPPIDILAPVSTARVTFPAGSSVDLLDGQVLSVSTVEVRVHLELDEPGTIHYTMNDTIPAPSNPETGVGYAPVSVLVQENVVVRWYAQDRVGNIENKAHRVEVRFDREPPVITFSPPGGSYGGEVEVEVSTNEPSTLYWTLDGRAPVAGSATAFEAPAPAIIRPSGAVTLRVLAEDAAGNTVEAEPQTYDVDDVPPRTIAEPQGGHFLGPITVDLLSDDPDATIHYTSTGEDPDESAAVWSGPLLVDATLDLRFRAVDPHGNLEAVRYALFEIGPRPARAPRVSDEGGQFDMVGGLELGAAMLRASGALSGRPGWTSSGADWSLWAAGRDAVDALTLHAGVGPHVMRSPGMVDISAAGEGMPDTGLDGFNLDETWAARVDALAAEVGGAPPVGLFPVSLPYERATASLAGTPSAGTGESGAPAWTDALESVRWVATPDGDRRVTPDALAAALDAVVARAWSGTEGRHALGDDPWAGGAGPVVGRRCAGCHGETGVEPRLTTAAQVNAAGIADGAALGLWLTGQGGHPLVTATAAEIRMAGEWAGEPSPAGSAYGVGREGRDALGALVALDQATFMMHHAWTDLVFDPSTGRLTSGETAQEGYLCGVVEVLEGSTSNEIPPHVQQLTVEDRTFHLGPQARLLEALLEYLQFTAARPTLFGDGPLAGSAALADGPSLAQALAAFQLNNIVRLLDQDGFLQESWHPDAGSARAISAEALADAMTALRGARASGYGGPRVDTALENGFRILDAGFLRPDGDYAARISDAFGLEPGPKRLSVQLAVLRALLLEAEADGGVETRAAAEALWARLESLWWDDDVGLWQPTLGLVDYRYSTALFARALEAGRSAARAGLPQADVRLRRVAEALLTYGRLGETWLSGETDGAGDADGDGVPHFGGAGVPPVPADEVVF